VGVEQNERDIVTHELDRDLAVERHDVFDVMQVTRGSALEALVAADLVGVEPHQQSSMHRHNNAETVLYFLSGSGQVLLTAEHTVVEVTAGDRLGIPRGMFHAVRTFDETLRFLSVQSPPILDITSGIKDLEPLAQ
jgi:oxalate decarboxylase/phosphoglucose isomerase-like protein (cupin superfamily)